MRPGFLTWTEGPFHIPTSGGFAMMISIYKIVHIRDMNSLGHSSIHRHLIYHRRRSYLCCFVVRSHHRHFAPFAVDSRFELGPAYPLNHLHLDHSHWIPANYIDHPMRILMVAHPHAADIMASLNLHSTDPMIIQQFVLYPNFRPLLFSVIYSTHTTYQHFRQVNT